MSFHKTVIMGNLGADPELKTAASGTVIASFKVAVNDRVKEKGEWVDHTEWYKCVCFGKTAENLGKFKKKGDPILVEGKLKTRSWEKDGVKQYMTELLADQVVYVGGGAKRESTGNSTADGGAPDDDIPF